jgi:transcriptional regulator with XRE-family HTH domain
MQSSKVRSAEPTLQGSAILLAALQRLKASNARTSIRSLAQRTGITPSYLSKILRGLKPISTSLLLPLSQSFSLDPIESRQLQEAILRNIENTNLSPKTGVRILHEDSPDPVSQYKTLSKSDFFE